MSLDRVPGPLPLFSLTMLYGCLTSSPYDSPILLGLVLVERVRLPPAVRY